MHFFPRKLSFWFYHFAALIAVIGVDLVTSINQGQININILKVSLLFAVFFTSSALVFRFFFNILRWYLIPYHRQIFALLLAGSALSVLVTFAIVTVCYYSALFNPIYIQYIGRGSSLIDAYTSSFMLRQCLQTQLFICSWIFIYTSITHQRHAVSAEVLNLEFENSLKTAQIENFNTQLNPHFLFNALNNIRFMIAESVDSADDMVVTLSELLRYALEIAKLDKVPLRSELDMLDKYMQLVKVQYEGKLIYHSNVDSGLLNYQLPPMMLQLLMENAVKYGVESSKSTGVITLTVKQSEQHLILQLANTLPQTDNVSAASLQIGLSNIKGRLSLLYGNNGTFNTQITERNFIATLTIPKEVPC